MISNDKLKSVEHGVVANEQGSRVWVACLFTTSLAASSKLYEPIRSWFLMRSYRDLHLV
ncbi:putative deacetoxyvindoline 4-hydroxylase [Helianthus debilis subsp. tardiflorus]